MSPHVIAQITVHGTPQPQGNMRAFAYRPTGGGPVQAGVTSSNAGPLGRWRTDVRAAAQSVITEGWDLLNIRQPAKVNVAFYFQRPASHYHPVNTKRTVPVLRDDAPYWHTKKPDADKCARAILDALTGIVWEDDSCVADLHARKYWADTPGCVITISEMVATP